MTTKKTIRTLTALTEAGLVDASHAPQLEKVIDSFSLSITSQMHELIDRSNPEDPIAKQFVPSTHELTTSPIELVDPISDDPFTMVKGIVHRYPDRCLFTPVLVCPIYCRFCFRKEKIGAGSESLTPAELEAAFAYIKDHSEIWEVILTGGDPLILKPAQLKSYIQKLSTIEHVQVIRIHTRVPVIDSSRITAEMIDALKCNKAVYVNLHVNHPKEFTDEAIRACHAIVDAGIPMLSQTLLLKGVNDTIEVLSQLMRCFIKNRIKPYYLHQGDLAIGTSHFRTTIAEGKALMKQLRGRFSGICQPTYVLDIPGGYGKVPIGPSYITLKDAMVDGEECYLVEDYHGNRHDYPPCPASNQKDSE